MYSLTTNDVKVTVAPYYLESQSIPSEKEFAWAYQVEIENLGEKTVQLISRHWIITDDKGVTREVKGAGVVGEQPVLNTGDVHEYTSGVNLNSESGIMSGTYQFIYTEDAEGKNTAIDTFNVDIPAFSLDSPELLARPN